MQMSRLINFNISGFKPHKIHQCSIEYLKKIEIQCVYFTHLISISREIGVNKKCDIILILTWKLKLTWRSRVDFEKKLCSKVRRRSNNIPEYLKNAIELCDIIYLTQ